MNKYYFHFHPKHKLSAFYCEVIAESLEIAKQAITLYLGYLPYDWYDQRNQDFNKNIYKKGCFASIKQREDK